MSYIIYALVAAFCFGVSQILNKLLSKHSINNSESLMAYFMMATFVFGLFLVPFVPLTIPTLYQLLLMFVATSAFLLGYYLFYKGIFTADASTFAPLFQLQAGLIAFLAFLFLGERFPLQNYFWMALLVIGTILVLYNEKMSLKNFITKGVAFILGMQVLHAVSNLFVGFILKEVSSLQLLFWEDMMIGILLVLFLVAKKPKLKYPVSQVYPMFISSFVVGLGVIALFEAFAQNLTISSVIGLLSAPMVFVVSLLASKISPTFLEHHSTKVYVVRGVGLLVILLGAYKITTSV